ncbi:MAG: DUF3488 domain-containing transglutaminase family protein [Betaproteobacteria bacterium]|nr:DUF3488 domain-containing transglutaminase family protein [Betaproteobacteria bacterium]
MNQSTLPFPNLVWLLAGLALAAAPHTGRLPWWVTGIASLLFAGRLYLGWHNLRLPNRWLVLGVAFGNFAGVFLTYRTIFGRDAGVTMLVVLLALKLMELRASRDVFIVTFLAYFLALTNFFYSQTIPTALLMLATVLVITASLVGFNALHCGPMENLKTAAILLAQAGPVMLILFVLFPRVSGPLWGLPQDAFAGVTGLSDTMSPGAISRLSQSDSIAFRVKFQGNPPPRQALYWRGPVFYEFDGRTWRAGGTRLRPSVQFVGLGESIDYEVTLEAHNRHWMFALDLPTRTPPGSRISVDYQILSMVPIRGRIRYDSRSYPSYRATSGREPEFLAMATRLPRGFNPRARELGAEWRRTLDSNEAIVQQAISFYRAGRFEYTLLPPLLGENTVDEFLFGTKQGFCEHFASSFVFLMRAAGIPARVVTGYQGGDVNPIDQYMAVRQADAHAWAEVWLEDRGWVRVDPTAAAAPIRVESGLAAAMPQGSVLPLFIRADLGWIMSVRDNWEALTNRWNQWVLGYNPDRQRDMLAFFGVRQPSWQTLAMLLFWGVASVLALIALWLLSRIRRTDAVQGAWLAYCAKLARAGLTRTVSEGPLDFTARALERFPARANELRSISDLYVDLRYGKRNDRQSVLELRSLVRAFRP